MLQKTKKANKHINYHDIQLKKFKELSSDTSYLIAEV